MKKKIITSVALSAAILSLPISSAVQAQPIQPEISITATNNENEQIVKAFITTENGLEEITLDEYNGLIASEQTFPITPYAQNFADNFRNNDSVISPMADNPNLIVTSRKFLQSGYWPAQLQTGMKTDMTDWIKNPGYKTIATTNVNWQRDWGWVASATVTSTWYKAVEVALGGGWEDKKSYSYSAGLEVQPRTMAKLTFTPIYNVTKGDLVGYNRFGNELSRQSDVTIKSPVTLPGGKTKGVVVVVEKLYQ
ncbi:hypothetical protein [Paenibacillus xylanivorans]|uniref:Uncharacterized protein n=1 Tax=Paenibacillus xylanivorans TaxID=1705561 RepID=A0A0M9BJJ4_9BACL|nr:hypothetical protein [Paenibacillus xylanivorans]KOY12736.1 hypothetical protein AMS66_30550 [Paenibacillus xylanivorans]